MMENRQMLKKYIKQVRGISYKPNQVNMEPKEGYIALLRATNIVDGELDLKNVIYVEESLVKEEQLLQKDDILIAASSGSLKAVGKSATFNGNGKFTFGAFCKVIRPIKINPDYLAHYFSSPIFKTTIQTQINGANIKNIKNEHIDNLKLFIPDSNKQFQIGKLLNLAKELITKRQQQICALDELTQSLFFEMFGNMNSNFAKWETLYWKDVFNTTTGKLDSNKMVLNGKYPFFTCAKEIFWIDEYAFDCEALLLAGNNAAGKYDVKHYKGKFNAYQRTYVLTLKNKNWKYVLFKYQLERKLEYLQHQSKGTNTRYLTMGILNELKFTIPPVDLQNDFASKVEQIENKKLLLQSSLEELKKMYKVLMHKAFNGEFFKDE